MPEIERPTTAFILSLLGGIFILLGGGMTFMIGSFGFGGMMNGYWGYGMMSGYGWSYGPGFGMMRGYGFTEIFGIVDALFGMVVIVSALMLYNNPVDHAKWGTVILIFSVLSIFGSAMAGLGIGLILGFIGGILALTWKPPTTKK